MNVYFHICITYIVCQYIRKQRVGVLYYSIRDFYVLFFQSCIRVAKPIFQSIAKDTTEFFCCYALSLIKEILHFHGALTPQSQLNPAIQSKLRKWKSKTKERSHSISIFRGKQRKGGRVSSLKCAVPTKWSWLCQLIPPKKLSKDTLWLNSDVYSKIKFVEI